MALFFTFRTQRPKADVESGVLCAAWHPEVPMLAVAFDTATVQLYNDEGDKVSTKGVSRPTAICSCLSWHPRQQLLATGWRDGSLVIWAEGDEAKEAPNVHGDRPITVLLWNPTGSRLLSADRDGTVAVWRCDGRQLTPLLQIKKAASVTHMVFRTPLRRSEAEAGEEGGESLAMEDLDAPPEDDRSPASRFSRHCVFFFGGNEGVVYIGDDRGNCQACTPPLESPVAALLYHPQKDGVVCLTQGMQLGYWTLDAHLQFSQRMKIKISAAQNADGGTAQVAWVGPGLLVTCNLENVLRFWNLDKEENYVLPLPDRVDREDTRKPGLDRIIGLAYNRRKRALAAATRDGRVVGLQFVGVDAASVTSEDWEMFTDMDIDSPVREVSWGPGEGLMSVSLLDCAHILHETVLKRKMSGPVAVIQQAPDSVVVECLETPPTSYTVRTEIRVKGLDLSGTHFVLWDGRKVELYQLPPRAAPTHLHTFDHPVTTAAVHPDFVFIAKGPRIEVHNHQGHKIQTLQFTPNEGEPIALDVHSDFLAAATTKQALRMWRLGKEAKGHGTTKTIFGESDGEIASIRLNADGSKVSVLLRVKDASGHLGPDPRLHVFDLEADRLCSHDFGRQRRYPISHCWDEGEPRLLGCETRRFTHGEAPNPDEGETSVRIEVATLFVSQEKGVVLQDSFPLERSHTALVGLGVPTMYFYCRFGSRDTHLEGRAMPNFEKINCADPKVKTALVNFSYYLTMGNMDEAYKAVKTIKDENVWHNMAAMCVKTRRLDVAAMCLGNMQDATAARALREARSEPEVEAQVAMLAIQLNMVAEAERLYKQCKRYDLLGKLYLACGKWDLALQVAEKSDRIHLRSIHYAYARHFEDIGDLDVAITHYEASRTHRYEVPRMLWNHQQIAELELYVKRSEDKDLLCWLAQYRESNAEYDPALQLYQQAGDTLSRVRLYCFMNDTDTAKKLVEQTQDKIAAYHLARHYEDQGQLRDAIQYFTISGAYRRAISISKDQDMEQDVLQLALLANKEPILLDAAAYFEARGMEDKAVTLYQRGGDLQRAIDICVRGKLFDVLTQIADELDPSADPMVFVRCGDFFLENSQFPRAVQMFISAKAYDRALQVCLDNEVQLTDEMAESMTLPKTEDEDAEVFRIALLKKVAKVAKIQASYQLACKKYTQAGEKVKAMQMLLKSGDRERIVFFAQHSRVPEIYVMAANFLQTQDWHSDPELMKTIIAFYTKARALESVATFYDACAQVEIDEYRDYEKALDALREAVKYLTKAKGPERDVKLQQLQGRIEIAERFVQARTLVKTDPEGMVRMCHQLLGEGDIEASVRVGDIFALLIEFYWAQGNYQEAYGLIEKMRDRSIVLSYYLEQTLVESVYAAVGVEMEPQLAGEEVIPEDV